MQIAPGNTAVFIINFNPTDIGFNYITNVQIRTNCKDNELFSFWIKGIGAEIVYKIGDTGPAGGIIFYDAGAVINGWRYLEASTVSFLAEWGPRNVLVGGTGSSIGDGRRNTQRIVAVLNERGLTLRAAQICADLNMNGFTDWFLPSSRELFEMYLMREIIGGFVIAWHWSSSEGNSYVALARDFRNGNLAEHWKDDTNWFRPIRAF
jgi:hypothetical protein